MQAVFIHVKNLAWHISHMLGVVNLIVHRDVRRSEAHSEGYEESKVLLSRLRYATHVGF